MTKYSGEEQLLTVPKEITDHQTFFLTGNEYVSLPHINSGGGITTVNVLHLGHRGLLEFSGDENTALVTPLLKVNGQTINLDNLLSWNYELDWIPTFTLITENGFSLEGEIAAPPGFKGFYYSLNLSNTGNKPLAVEIGWQGCWNSFNYIVFNRRAIDSKRPVVYDPWTRSTVLEASAGLPLAALAMAIEPETAWQIDTEKSSYYATHELQLKPGATFQTRFFAAANLEADGAGTTVIDLRRHGSLSLKETTTAWLAKRSISIAEHNLDSLLNRNLFFTYFYALGRSIDSEELVPVTSRSPHYYVSAAFWSRDTLLWSFPAIMMTDQTTARELLLTVFKRHIKNAGDHAHYINGTVLYPGFELDQLAAYYLALEHYLDHSGDHEILKEVLIQDGLNILTEKALASFDHESGLYRTFLDPSDDPVFYPFLTYSNALLEKAFRFLGRLQLEDKWQHNSDFAFLAQNLHKAVFEHCTVKGPFGTMFAWAVDGKGRFSLYDNPPGSLQLLAYYGFCSITDVIFKNTVRWIRSSNNEYYHQGSSFEEAGSQHALNPWPLSACNDLLACNVGALDFFSRAEMDNGFFCETVNPETGRVSTGAAFASAAGFLAYALKYRHTENKCLEEKQEPEN